MIAYFDSSVLIKLYTPEPNSAAAVALVRTQRGPILLSQVQENEVRNAIRLKAVRAELTATEAHTALGRVQDDIAAGCLRRPLLDWPAVWTQADELSARHVASASCRTLDTLHVAVALALGFKTFASFDVRQRKLAAAAGLRVVP